MDCTPLSVTGDWATKSQVGGVDCGYGPDVQCYQPTVLQHQMVGRANGLQCKEGRSGGTTYCTQNAVVMVTQTVSFVEIVETAWRWTSPRDCKVLYLCKWTGRF